jgi:hypothetical protein
MASLDDIQTTIQSINGTLSDQVSAFLKQVPSTSSGLLTGSKIVQVGFVRVTGISIVTGGAAGGLHDTNVLASIAGGNKIYTVGTTLGFYPVNLVFLTGLAYAPGAGQEIAIMYTRL